ncbi:MATE family drug/sodium antiporter [Haloferax mucosum ATCC BAA-1512]|uniref:MATE family drug/sodium antiporter n=1 Tax=Haloferax mucosum ATCC BAA-1512 TaxID=662479 RepID=M0ITI6_9EURY|nr:MATE family efflux transporter [Haloferax mucosum]ELZ98799.1 MATE family drug/sodium antiporter [Haloferax mucosum ATCC BAA-1512]
MGIRTALVRLFTRQDDLDLTSGSIARPLGILALPVIITNVIQTVYTLVDTFWLGQYSTASLAAITLAYPLAYLLLSVSFGLPVAGSIHVAQATGGEAHERAAHAAAQTVTYGLLSGTVVGVLGFFFVDDVLALYDITSDVHRFATSYLQIMSLGLPSTVGFVAFLSLMRGSGDTITPLPVMLGSITLNALLDPILIYGWRFVPELGIRGAAIATFTARTLAALVGFYLLFASSRGLDVEARHFWPDFSWGRKLARTGLPTSVEQMGRGISINLLLVIVGTFSTAAVAGYGIGIRVISTIGFATVGISRGVETMTGQNIGAGKLDRAVTTNYRAAAIAFGSLTAIAVLTWLTARPIVSLFTDEPATIRFGVSFLHWVVPTFGFIGVLRTFVGGFRGIGMTTVAAAIVLTTRAVIRLPLSWFGAQAVGPSGVWISIAVSNVVGAVLAVAWFRLGSWRDNALATLGDATRESTDAVGSD